MPMQPSSSSNSRAQGPTLARKIMLRVLPVVTTSMLVVALSNYFVGQLQISDHIDNEVRMLAGQVAVSTQNFLDQRTRDLDSLTETPLLRDYHANVAYELHLEAGVYRQEIESYFLQFTKRSNVYDVVAYYDSEGQLVAGVAEQQAIDPARPISALPVSLSRIMQQQTYRSSILRQGTNQQWVIARAVHLEDRGFTGTLVLVCNLSSLEDILHRTQVGAAGRAYMLDDSGEAVLGKPPTGQADLHHTVPLPASPWSVVVDAHSEEFIGPLARLRNLTMLLAVVVTTLVIATLIAGIRGTMRPLNEVVAGTRRLAEGELDHRLPLPEIRDLKPLASAFNDMADKLKERNEQLESRIRQLSTLRLIETTSMQRTNEEAFLRTCLRAVADGLGVDRVILYWIDHKQNVIAGRYLHGPADDAFTEAVIQQHCVSRDAPDVLNRVVASRQPLLVSNPDAEPDLDPHHLRASGTREFVLAPLCGKNEVFGAIGADNRASDAPLSEQHRDGLLLFASAIGLALENAILFDRITESEARHRTVLDNSPIAILGVSRDNHIRTWNRGAEAIFGHAADQILGQPLRSLVAPHALPQFQTMLEQLRREGAVHGYQLKGQAQDGGILDLSVFCGGNNKEDFLANDEWTIVINDVTESRKLQDQLIKSEKLSAVGQLIAGVAHELNNPLQAVVGYSELMTERMEAGRGDQELQHVLDNAIRCRNIVDNLLLFVRHGDIDHSSVSVQGAVTGALKLLNHKFRRAPQLHVVNDLPEQALYVNGNFQQIEQVLINLLTNAYDALESWQGEKEIRISARTVGDQIRVEVADSGPGVPEGKKAQLFEPLYTTKPEGHGTGLGLPLCRQIIESHKGTFDVFNGPQGGAVFYFDLPTAAAPIAPPAEATPPREQSETLGCQVLLLEDEASVRSLLCDLLTAEGHEVQAAENVAQARALAGEHYFDLVVSDVHLPDGTGLEFFQSWGRNSSRPRPRFLFLTGDIVTQKIEQLCQENGSRVLQKPVNLRSVRQTLRALLQGRPADAIS